MPGLWGANRVRAPLQGHTSRTTLTPTDRASHMLVTTRKIRSSTFILALMGFLVFGGFASAQVSEEDQTDVTLIPFRSDMTFDFQNRRGPITQTMRIDVSESTASLPTVLVLGDFVSDDGPYVLPAGDVETSLTEDAQSQTFLLTVTVSPSISAWDAGVYSSSLRIQGEGFEPATIPVTLSFRSGPYLLGGVLVLAILLTGLAIGVLFKATEPKPTPQVPADASRWRQFVIRRGPFLTGLVSAAVVTVFGFDTQYLDKTTFGVGGFSDWLGLVLWGFAAGFSGKTINDFTAAKAAG
jgi:hypothetical protein